MGALAVAPTVPASSWVRVTARLWIVATVLIPIAVFVIPPWRHTASWAGLARAVDDRVPETLDQLLTAVDLAAALDARSIAEPETERLARVHLGVADKAAELVSPEAILPITGLPGATLLGPVASGILFVLWILNPARFEAGLDGVFAPLPPSAEVVEAAGPADDVVNLTLRNLSVRLVPPAYSGRAEVILEGTTGDIQALPGTRVFLKAQTTSSGKSVQVALEDTEQSIEGDLSGKEISLEFGTTNSTWYRVVMQRGFARSPLQSRRFRIELLPDRPPELEVMAPPGQITLAASDSLPLSVRASDDFALSRLEHVILLDGVELMRAPVADVGGLASHDGLLRWTPETLNGKGGDLELVVEAWDNDMVNGPKMTRSRPVEIYVPTARDQHRKVLQLKRDVQAAALDLLAELLVADDLASIPAPRAGVLTAHDAQVAIADSFFRIASELFEGMMRDELEKGNSYAGILQLVENLDVRWSATVEFVENKIRPVKRTVVHPVLTRELSGLREPVVAELEQIVLDLGSFIDQHLGDEMRGDVASLGEQFGDMQEMLRRAQEGDPMDKEIAAAMEKLRERMAELAKKIAERSSGPDDGFVNSMPGQLSKSMLAEVQELIAQGRYEEAMEKLREADEALAGLEESLGQESSEMAGSQEADELMQALSEAIEEAKKLEAQQEHVLRETDELKEQFAGSESAEQLEELRQDIGKLKEQVDQLRQGGTDPFVPTGAERSRVRSAAFEVGGIEAAMNEGMQDEAAAYAREAQAHLEDAARAANSDQRARKEREAAKLAGSIAQRLEQLEAQRRRGQSQAQRAGQQVGERQGGVAQGVGQLSERMQQGVGGSAFNPAQGRQSLANAEQLMRRAQGQLAQGDPSRAGSAGQDGLNQLRQFRESMEAARDAMQQGGPPRPGGKGQPGGQPGGQQQGSRRDWDSQSGQKRDSGTVELTDPDEFVGPEAYRALLQEGAQGEAPERYKPLNGTYYEELVR